MANKVVFDNEAIKKLFTDLRGPVSQKLKQEGDEIVQDTKEWLDNPQPPRVKGQPHKNIDERPWSRTGDLMNSVKLAGPFIDPETGQVAYGVIADADHGGGQYVFFLMDAQALGLSDHDFDPVPPIVREHSET